MKRQKIPLTYWKWQGPPLTLLNSFHFPSCHYLIVTEILKMTKIPSNISPPPIYISLVLLSQPKPFLHCSGNGDSNVFPSSPPSPSLPFFVVSDYISSGMIDRCPWMFSYKLLSESYFLIPAYMAAQTPPLNSHYHSLTLDSIMELCIT